VAKQAGSIAPDSAAARAGRQPPTPPRGALAAVARDLYPGSFALVMATGIVSIAAHLIGMDLVAWPLFGLNVIAYAALWLLVLVRLRVYPARVWADLADHARGPGFLTLATASCVLGAQVLLFTANTTVSAGLAALALGLWLGLTYTFLVAVAIGCRKPSLERGLSGSWLLLVVSTQALCVLGAQLAPRLQATQPLLFAALSMYLLGCLLYVVLAALLLYRLVFVRLLPAEFTPDDWIGMGAAAITTLAGATLVASSGRWAFLSQLRPFLTAFSLLFWAVATWWIPLLIALDVWRHLPGRGPLLVAGPEAWGRVFPLGMYTTGTLELARATGVDGLLPVASVGMDVAVLAWLLTLVACMRGQLAHARPPAARAWARGPARAPP
jgi:tellurite resistance protein TehA-like permease